MSERPHGLTRHRHGPDENGVEGKGCHCKACLRAKKAASIRYENRVRQLGCKLTVPAEPVRVHVRSLMDHGLAVVAISKEAGVSVAAIRYLLYGRPSRGLPPSQRVTRRTAHSLLDVPYSLLPSRGWVPVAGVRRRLQALGAVGFPAPAIAAELGRHHRLIRRLQRIPTQTRVDAQTAREIRRLYERWWNADPTQYGVLPSEAAKARAYADKRGWVLAAYWDDDEIDNPGATPHQPDMPFRYLAIAEDAEYLINRQGCTVNDAAERIGVTRDYLDEARARARNYLDRKSA